jgi:putative tryptophan/tyrosine transport system substrate-binding protein
MRRREFITFLGSAAAAWPLVAKGQQGPGYPVIGFLSSDAPDLRERRFSAFRQGLSEGGYNEGRNAGFEYRFSEEHLDLLPALSADLVHRGVALIFASPTPAATAAKAATKSIPIVFVVGVDPVQTGLVASLARPGGNLTGISNLSVASKRLELLHELLPTTKTVGYLVNPTNRAFAEPEARDMKVAAQTLGVNLLIENVTSPSGFDGAFAAVMAERPGGIVISGESLFLGNSTRLVALAAQHRVPTVYPIREATAAGGLVSYSADPVDAGRQAGVYAGRILKGEKPESLPVQQTTKTELVLNLKTAKSLGLTVSLPLIGRADALIE